MNAALLMMSCCLAGGEKPMTPPPPPVTAAPPVVLHSIPSTGCGNCAPGICAGTADPMPDESKPSGGLFSKLKSKISSIGRKKSSGDCGCAPPCASYAPAPVACDTCGSGKSGGLLSRLKARLGGRKGDGPYVSGCDAGCGCGVTSAYPTVPGGTIITPGAPTGEAPKEMQKPKDPKSAGLFPSGPVTPVAGPALATAKSPF